MPGLHARLAAHVDAILDDLERAAALPVGIDRRRLTIEPTRDPMHGDLTVNAAILLAGPAGVDPHILAEAIAARLAALFEIAQADVAGPGFINLRMTDQSWYDELLAILSNGIDYGRSPLSKDVIPDDSPPRASLPGANDADVLRLALLLRRPDAAPDIDPAALIEPSLNNPVFNIHYAHARSRALRRRAAEAGIDLVAAADLALLDPSELALIKRAAQFPHMVETAAMTRQPRRIAFYLDDLATRFHALVNHGNDDPTRRFLRADSPEITRARLALSDTIGQIIRNGLSMLGVAASEEIR